MHAYVDSLVNGGVLFMSGFLSQDKTVITAKAQELGLSPHQSLEQDNWMMLSFVKTIQ
jgi:ribosomal protein L11 methyltransferase